MAARVPASQLAPLSKLEAEASLAKLVAEPVRSGSFLELPRFVAVAPALVLGLAVAGGISSVLGLSLLSIGLSAGGALVFLVGVTPPAARLVELLRVARLARPTTDRADPGRTIDVGIGSGVMEIQQPAPLPRHPYRNSEASERRFIVGDVAAGRARLVRALAGQVMAAAVACGIVRFTAPVGLEELRFAAPPAPPEPPPTPATMHRLAMRQAVGWVASGPGKLNFPKQPRPAVADVNGDGTRDFVVLSFEADRSPAEFLAGYDGVTLAKVWTSDSLRLLEQQDAKLVPSGSHLAQGLSWETFETKSASIGLGDDRVLRSRDRTVVRAESKATENSWQEPYFLPEDSGSSFTPRAFDLDTERFYFAYELEAGGRRVGARSIESGAVAWKAESVTHPESIVRGLAEAEGRLLLVTETHLELRSAASGELLAIAGAHD